MHQCMFVRMYVCMFGLEARLFCLDCVCVCVRSVFYALDALNCEALRMWTVIFLPCHLFTGVTKWLHINKAHNRRNIPLLCCTYTRTRQHNFEINVIIVCVCVYVLFMTIYINIQRRKRFCTFCADAIDFYIFSSAEIFLELVCLLFMLYMYWSPASFMSHKNVESYFFVFRCICLLGFFFLWNSKTKLMFEIRKDRFEFCFHRKYQKFFLLANVDFFSLSFYLSSPFPLLAHIRMIKTKINDKMLNVERRQ